MGSRYRKGDASCKVVLGDGPTGEDAIYISETDADAEKTANHMLDVFEETHRDAH